MRARDGEGGDLPPSNLAARPLANMRLRLHRELVEGWLSWSVIALAMRRTNDVDLAVRTARRAIVDLWNE